MPQSFRTARHLIWLSCSESTDIRHTFVATSFRFSFSMSCNVIRLLQIYLYCFGNCRSIRLSIALAFVGTSLALGPPSLDRRSAYDKMRGGACGGQKTHSPYGNLFTEDYVCVSVCLWPMAMESHERLQVMLKHLVQQKSDRSLFARVDSLNTYTLQLEHG